VKLALEIVAQVAAGLAAVHDPAMARPLCASRHGALADIFQFTRRRKQKLGKERGGPRRVLLAEDV
jgi:hypothetical protein